MKIQAAVARDKDSPLSIEMLNIEKPRPNEVLVRVVGVGICHTDVKAWKQVRPVPLPAVFGHEGSGIVEAVGSMVTKVQVGDSVVMTFPSCGTCDNCQSGHSNYCENGETLSFGAKRADGTSPLSKDDEHIHAPFFQQSSFATYALAPQRNVIKIDSSVPLELMGPLGCGMQTGAGAVLNALKAEAGSSIVIFGAGSVGLSAIMAAKITGCTTIIAVDIQPSRLELALELGATHVINPLDEDPVAAIRKITGKGAHYSIDTSGRADVFNQAAQSIRIQGTCGLIGGMAPGQQIGVEANHLLIGRKLRGIIQGDSVPDIFIPRMISLYKQGVFPFNKLVTFYEFDQINEAIDAMKSGAVIKPILRMSPTKEEQHG